MDDNTRITGQNAEMFACLFLQRNGLRLVMRNYLCRLGEIDIIMKDQEHIVFVEVRYRKSLEYGGGVESITYSKQNKLRKAALCYLKQERLFEKEPCRFDVVAISNSEVNPCVEWIKNAF